MVDLQNKNHVFRYFGLIAILLLHNLDACSSVDIFFDKALLQGDVHSSTEATVEQKTHASVTAPPHHPAAATNLSLDVSDSILLNNRKESLPPIVFPTNSPNSSSPVRILTIDDCANISAHLMSMLNISSLPPQPPPVVFPAPPSANVSHMISLLSAKNTSTTSAEADDMTHSKKYDGQYDVDDVKGISKKYNHTKENHTKNVTKPPSVVDVKKDSKIDSIKNDTKSPTPEVNNKTATVEDAKAEATPLPESKNKTNFTEKTEKVHKGEAKLIVLATQQPEVPTPQKSSSTLREVGKTLAAIMVTIVGTTSMLFVGFLMWRRISRRYYGHREMLINEDDFEEISDLHHFEGTADTQPSQNIISQR